MNREEFEKIIADKGWTPLLLGQRWSLSDRRIRMIKAELSEAKPYYKDAVRGLHKLSSSPDESEITRYSGFTAKQLRAVYEKKAGILILYLNAGDSPENRACMRLLVETQAWQAMQFTVYLRRTVLVLEMNSKIIQCQYYALSLRPKAGKQMN